VLLEDAGLGHQDQINKRERANRACGWGKECRRLIIRATCEEEDSAACKVCLCTMFIQFKLSQHGEETDSMDKAG